MVRDPRARYNSLAQLGKDRKAFKVFSKFFKKMWQNERFVVGRQSHFRRLVRLDHGGSPDDGLHQAGKVTKNILKTLLVCAKQKAFIFSLIYSYFLIRYEDFVTDPHSRLEELYKFAGIEYGEYVSRAQRHE